MSTSPPSSVPGASILDGAVAVRRHGLAHADALAATLGRTGPAQHRDVTVHDDLVLDEDAVGTVVRRRRLDDRPAAPAEHVDVLLPLPQGQVAVDRPGALDVRHDPVRESGRRTADEGKATVHALTLGAGIRWKRPGGSAPGTPFSLKGLDPHAT